MHTKQTVRYICEIYSSGNEYFYKRELITHDSWDNIDSLSWSALRPISKSTFMKRKKEGYKTEIERVDRPPAKVIAFPAIPSRD
ncbi:hypothetical protein M3689_04095 [Alkalihalophilus marmarensis]|jgi:hypothetical protein|uniref:Uncharacterized protein n=1 Tax=Alkalihalophilus marmarensis DSM 21297 TaxID=1188261 RepID=U6STF6_9BACI|nr:hypothetical protein [Alkalihalophilus marmarensis]ERN54893.1 hypothetical protein A33I_05965 [Alkalihalophilus marmarensis DSM 21297]MCM3488487.1 hypothetical protein [Alkalihalophilus marmarensis]